ncbi:MULTISPECIES: LacI family DNA-binding transcriptional regulator [Marinilactibacillus]|uniref:LacI family transcriptional regulator n=2 Tax=Marinilactibacillus TaxID=191769 RepID=A0A5R9C7Q4_9LACT|nr:MULTISPECIES: LacI family DNA-binding transcriptional regulator [Marinilactibacillus]TLQ09185.1 LacI family transcriptional regulator [Marinilactibacillus psychrotolerans]SFK16719.1 transcriptional regulator, LacI family [Marinilactibacillus piezotolerans]
MTGIKDIAKKANVSISTVSYALNNSSKVSEKTRKRILMIADEMNYIPNRAGQNLRRKQTRIIGVHLSSYSGSFYGDLLDGIHNMAKELGFDIIACSGEKSRLFLPQGMIDGIIVLDQYYPDEQLLKYAEEGHSIVVLDRQLEHENIRHVLLDNQEGMKQAVQSLKSSPVEVIDIIGGPKGNFDSKERLKTATQEISKLGKKFRIYKGEFTEESGYLAAREIAAEAKKQSGLQAKKIQIIALNDEMGIGAYNYFKNSSLNTETEVKIIGFDNLVVSRYLDPKMHSVTYSKREWGAVGMNTLYKMLNGERGKDALISTKFSANQ